MSASIPDTQGLGFRRQSVNSIMCHVMLALIPGTLVYATLIDFRIVSNVFIAIAAGLCAEAFLLRLRHRAVLPVLYDGSIVLAAWLLALCVPPSLPAWQLIAGVGVMAGLGKHLFGGLGQNPFNPAMVAYAVLIVSFPVTMTNWQSNDHVHDASRNIPLHDDGQVSAWDGITGATPLDRLRQARTIVQRQVGTDTQAETVLPTGAMTAPHEESGAASIGNVVVDMSADPQAAAHAGSLAEPGPGTFENLVSEYSRLADALIMHSPWKWVSLAWLAGGIYLLLIRIITWHIPASILLTVSLLYAAYGSIDSVPATPFIPALLSGALMIGAFFIATDPVSAATGNAGKLIYGAGIGVFTFIIREFSIYPEGVAFAVLLMNACVPLLDYLFTRAAATSDTGRT